AVLQYQQHKGFAATGELDLVTVASLNIAKRFGPVDSRPAQSTTSRATSKPASYHVTRDQDDTASRSLEDPEQDRSEVYRDQRFDDAYRAQPYDDQTADEDGNINLDREDG